jgi:hypothetical protein
MKSVDGGKDGLVKDYELSIYEAMTNRRTTYDIMMWQAPILSLTAQAFLLTIALGADSSRLARLLAAGLALISALGSMHLMAKHRFSGNIDSRLLKHYEERIGIKKSLGISMHGIIEDRAKMVDLKRRWYIRQSSFKLWMTILALFAVTAAIVLLITWLAPRLL